MLPGGLTRVALKQGIAGRQLVAGRRQQGHVGARRRPATRRAQPRRQAPERRNASPLLSRVADPIYWMSRYIERAENVARFIDVNLNLSSICRSAPAQQWRPLVDTTGDAEDFSEALRRGHADATSSSS